MKSKIGQTAEFEFGGLASTLRDLRAVVEATQAFPEDHLVTIVPFAPGLAGVFGSQRQAIRVLLIEPAPVYEDEVSTDAHEGR
jgi:hypothetical protein